MKMHIFRNMLYKSFIKALQKLLYIYIYFEFVLHKTWQTRPQSFTKNAEMTSIVPNSDSKWVNNCAGRFWTDTRGTIAVVHEQWLFLSGPLLIGQADILSRHWQSSCPTDWTLSNVSMSMLKCFLTGVIGEQQQISRQMDRTWRRNGARGRAQHRCCPRSLWRGLTFISRIMHEIDDHFYYLS